MGDKAKLVDLPAAVVLHPPERLGTGFFEYERHRATLTRAGGLDTEHQWADILSLGEQQLLAFSRVLLAAPEFVFLDHPTRALSECQVGELLGRLRAHMICYLTLGDEDDDPHDYDQLLEIAADGTWTLHTLREAVPSIQPQGHISDRGWARPLA